MSPLTEVRVSPGLLTDRPTGGSTGSLGGGELGGEKGSTGPLPPVVEVSVRETQAARGLVGSSVTSVEALGPTLPQCLLWEGLRA